MNSLEHQKNETVALLEGAKSDFEHVIQIAITAKNTAAGSSADLSGIVADTLLLRCILTGSSIYQILHPARVGSIPSLSLPDWPSMQHCHGQSLKRI